MRDFQKEFIGILEGGPAVSEAMARAYYFKAACEDEFLARLRDYDRNSRRSGIWRSVRELMQEHLELASQERVAPATKAASLAAAAATELQRPVACFWCGSTHHKVVRCPRLEMSAEDAFRSAKTAGESPVRQENPRRPYKWKAKQQAPKVGQATAAR